MNIPSEIRDEDLLLRMMAGDEDAFTLLYRRRQGGIYRFARQMTGNSGIAEEVTQETFLALIRRPERFDPARGSVLAFLFGVARNLVLRTMGPERCHVGQNGASDSDSSQPALDNEKSAGLDPSMEYERTQIIEQVRRAVLVLPLIYREVVVLCELEEMTYEEAAAVLDCAVGTVRSRLHRARTLLLQRLSALLPAQPNFNSSKA
ncbi:MAG TPA: sigma-70 family RNA polymerase sigma factor [Terriglobia bacterium]|nr:sigma-70 family RNA polymerase sigma factor [Terriglobia bacterium]